MCVNCHHIQENEINCKAASDSLSSVQSDHQCKWEKKCNNNKRNGKMSTMHLEKPTIVMVRRNITNGPSLSMRKKQFSINGHSTDLVELGSLCFFFCVWNLKLFGYIFAFLRMTHTQNAFKAYYKVSFFWCSDDGKNMHIELAKWKLMDCFVFDMKFFASIA